MSATVRIWDVESGVELAVLRGHQSWVASVAFSPDGRRIASGSGLWPSRDNSVRVWDAQTGECLEVIAGYGDVEAIAAGAASHETVYRAHIRAQEMVIENAASQQPIAWFGRPLRSIATHPSGRQWAGSVAGHLYLLQLEEI